MTKVIIINKCFDCPCLVNSCDYTYKWCSYSKKYIPHKRIEIPKWCELEDYEK